MFLLVDSVAMPAKETTLQFFSFYHLPTVLDSMALLQWTKILGPYRIESIKSHQDIHATPKLSICPAVQIYNLTLPEAPWNP